MKAPQEVVDRKQQALPQSTLTCTTDGIATRSLASKASTTNAPKSSSRIDDIVLKTEGSKTNMCRVNRYESHLATEPNKNAHSCQLHYWATGKRYRKGITHCPSCNVNLCLKCFAPFHLVKDLFGMKDTLKTTYAQDVGKGEDGTKSKKRRKDEK